jgi:hypothetical protein
MKSREAFCLEPLSPFVSALGLDLDLSAFDAVPLEADLLLRQPPEEPKSFLDNLAAPGAQDYGLGDVKRGTVVNFISL